MKISVRNLSFRYTDKPVFKNFNADLENEGRPLVILGPSGSGKTTLLKLLAGLLKPMEGQIRFSGTRFPKGGINASGGGPESLENAVIKTAFMFQENRLLPWLNVLENVSLPLEKEFGREEGRARARHFLSLVSLGDKESSYPDELSGGQAKRVSMARAFAWPAPVLFMDEPFQSLDIPLRISLIDLALSLLEEEKRLLVTVTHDPRAALYLGERIIILGQLGQGIVFDKAVKLRGEDRAYGSAAVGEMEREIIEVLKKTGF